MRDTLYIAGGLWYSKGKSFGEIYMTTWAEFLEEQLKNPTFKREYDALEDWYQEQLARQDALARAEKAVSPSHTRHPRKKSAAPSF